MADTESKEPMLRACLSALRIPEFCPDYDEEVTDLIGAARAALRAGGVSAEKAADDSDESIRVAIKVYVKANFGMDNPDHDRLSLSFDDMLTRLAHQGGYRGAS